MYYVHTFTNNRRLYAFMLARVHTHRSNGCVRALVDDWIHIVMIAKDMFIQWRVRIEMNWFIKSNRIRFGVVKGSEIFLIIFNWCYVFQLYAHVCTHSVRERERERILNETQKKNEN